jgi:hypothetical protein
MARSDRAFPDSRTCGGPRLNSTSEAGGQPPACDCVLGDRGAHLVREAPAGAQGIAQFMPGTARGMCLADPFDPDQAIDARRI